MKTYLRLLYKSFYDGKFVGSFVKGYKRSGFAAKIFLAIVYALVFSISSGMGDFSTADSPEERANKVKTALFIFIFGTLKHIKNKS